MARAFLASSSQYLELGSALLTAYPITMACWFRPVSATVAYALMSIADNVLLSKVVLNTTTGSKIQATSSGTIAASSATTTSNYSASVWQHAAATFASNTARAAYFNGGSKGTNATSRALSGLARTNIGCRYAGPTRGVFLNGDLAEAGIWNVELTDAEIAILAAGISPLKVRPQNLQAYWPLLGRNSPEPELTHANALTINGPTFANHPRVFYPHKAEVFGKPATTGTLPILGTLTATPGVGLVTLSQAVTFPGDGWALLLARSPTNGFTPVRLDTVGIAEWSASPIVHVDKKVPPGTWYYRASAFTGDGRQTAWTPQAQATVI